MMPKYDYDSPGSPLTADQVIPSELIEGYLRRFFMIQLESLAYGLAKPEKVRSDLQGLNYFVSCSCGVHARLAMSNEVDKLCRMTDKQMIETAKEVFKPETV